MNAIVRAALLLAGGLALLVSAPAQVPPAPAVRSTNGIGPRIQFNTENYDFEKVLAGDPVKYTFIATNTGDATLEISGAKGSCTCTVVGDGPNKNFWTPQKVAPGQTCLIPVEIATANYAGQNLAKFVTVRSDDKARPLVNLQIHGKVWLPVEVVPPTGVFDLAAGTATNSTHLFKIYNRMDTPLTLSEPASSTNAFSILFKTNIPGQEFELTVTTQPASLWPPVSAPTVIQGMITLKSSATVMDPIQIGIYETIHPEITVYPSRIQLFPGPLPQPSTNLVAIRDDSANLTLSAPGINATGVDVTVNVIQPNHRYNVFVVFPKGFDIQTNQNIAFTVKTDNPRFPTLSVPVAGMQRMVLSHAPAVPPPARTSDLPVSIRTNVPPNSTARVNPPHP